jgi:hypothetical protein
MVERQRMPVSADRQIDPAMCCPWEAKLQVRSAARANAPGDGRCCFIEAFLEGGRERLKGQAVRARKRRHRCDAA